MLRHKLNRLKHRNTQSGFTLIELLVVIAIIAILAAILFPVFSRVRENARRSSCQSNLKQIGLGLIQYHQDYDEVLISPAYGNAGLSSDGGNNYKWMDAIYPYVKSEQIFNCPSNSRVSQKYKYAGPDSSGTSPNYGSYAINATYFEGGANKRPPVSMVSSATVTWNTPGDFVQKSSLISAPSTTFWVSENTVGTLMKYGGSGNTTLGGLNYQYLIFTQGSDAPKRDATQPNNLILFGQQNGSSWSPGWAERHLETMNILYCDGHVKALTIDQMVKNSNGSACSNTLVCSNFTIQND